MCGISHLPMGIPVSRSDMVKAAIRLLRTISGYRTTALSGTHLATTMAFLCRSGVKTRADVCTLLLDTGRLYILPSPSYIPTQIIFYKTLLVITFVPNTSSRRLGW